MSLSIRSRTILGIAVIEAVMLALLLILMLGYLQQSNADALTHNAHATAQLFAVTIQNAVLSYDLAALADFVEKVSQRDDVVFISIVDQLGTTLMDQGQVPVELQTSLQQDLTTAISLLNQTEAHVYSVYQPMRVSDVTVGHLILGFDTLPNSLFLQKVTLWGVSVAGAELLLVALFSWFLGTYLTRRLNILTLSANRIARGDLMSPVDTQKNDEVGQVAQTLEWMRHELYQRQQEQRSVHQELETRVAQRTAEMVEARDHANTMREREAALYAMVGHEIRTPLAMIKMELESLPAEMIQKTPRLHAIQAQLQEALQLSDKMTSITQEANEQALPLPAYYEKSTHKSPCQNGVLQQRSVLVVEDSPILQELTQIIFEAAGASVTVASDGEEALAILAGQPVDLILTDIMMPKMDGFMMTSRLREQGYAGVIIGITAATMGNERADLLAKGADAVFAKPIELAPIQAFLATRWGQ